MFDARTLADHRHPHSNNQVSPCENLVNKKDSTETKKTIKDSNVIGIF